MKKILHISVYYPPSKGGIEQVAYDTVKALKGDYEQEVICFNKECYEKDRVDFNEDVRVTRIGWKRRLGSQILSLNFFKELNKKLVEFNPDIIHLHLPNPLLGVYCLLLSKKKRLILHWHSDIVKQKNLLRLYKPLQYKLLKRSDEIIVTSPNYKTSKYLKNFQEKLHVVPNVVDIKKFKMTKENILNIRNKKEKYNKNKIIFFLGRHVEYKGIEYLIEATKILKTNNVKVLIAGSGPLTKELKRKAQEIRGIEFLGRISDEELKEYLYVADIFAFPSITKNEAFGVALAEALYCETPAVTFTIEGSGVNWVNKDCITGIEVENSNIEKYANALDKLLSNNKLREEMAKNARKRVLEKFSSENLRKYLKTVYSIE